MRARCGDEDVHRHHPHQGGVQILLHSGRARCGLPSRAVNERSRSFTLQPTRRRGEGPSRAFSCPYFAKVCCQLYSVLTSRVARTRLLQHCGGHRRGEQALPHRGGHLQRQGVRQHRPRGQVSILLPDCGLQQTQQVRIEFLNFNVDTKNLRNSSEI